MKKRMTMIAVLVILAISLVLFTGTAGADGEPQACGNGVSWRSAIPEGRWENTPAR